MKKSSNESEKLDMSDPNIYLKVFNDKVKINEKISMDSIEVVLSNMTNLHNTIGKSYEVVATILGTLLNQIKQQKSGEEEKDIEYSSRFNELKEQILILQKELSESKKKTILLENEITKKDATISKLKLELEEAQKKKPERKIEIERERSQPGSPILDELELPIRDDRETHSEGGHSSKLEIDRKRKSNEPDIFDDDFNKDNEEVQSEIDKFKFRKLFKKVKKTGEQSTSIKSTGTHQDLKSKMFVPLEAVKGNLKDNDEGSELHNLLNNFSESTKTLEKRNSSAQSNEAAQNQLNNKEDSHSSNKLAKEKLNDAKMLKKENGGNFFTQQGAINDSLERELFPPETSVLPITSKDKSSQLMQKMMKSNQKRNTANTMSNSFFKINESQKTTPIESPRENPKEEKKSEPVPTRGVHRSKQERENLQGFECDQCQKFYNFIGDGTKIKPAGMCDKCSRHRDKFPLPSTPENFYKNFTLDSQDL